MKKYPGAEKQEQFQPVSTLLKEVITCLDFNKGAHTLKMVKIHNTHFLQQFLIVVVNVTSKIWKL
jgi:hypothetical protein